MYFIWWALICRLPCHCVKWNGIFFSSCWRVVTRVRIRTIVMNWVSVLHVCVIVSLPPPMQFWRSVRSGILPLCMNWWMWRSKRRVLYCYWSELNDIEGDWSLWSCKPFLTKVLYIAFLSSIHRIAHTLVTDSHRFIANSVHAIPSSGIYIFSLWIVPTSSPRSVFRRNHR